MGLLDALDRFNRAHPWSHNDAFAGFILRHARSVKRSGGRSAIDVGCGTGNLVERLSHLFPDVVGVEPDPTAAGIATTRFSNLTSVRIEQRHFGNEERNRYDFIVFVASLHHMPLAATLHHAKRSLRRGGQIVIVGVARETYADSPRSLLSLALNPFVGLIRHPSRATRPLSHMQAPATAATESFDEIQQIAGGVLPGIRMRRRLFWRYTATWRAAD
ncbi:class I SAM-dependent methyltransferase [Streptomyces sp. ISL-90]|nr:class I SAM-dependent methyltransferase [Streptomyces sp. ISL-90]